ncbi:putative membrane protein [Aspergillus homomorphus CBS 101889]|uniref:Very-long-chain (3R)-3-hydroxyacyl-CoA dehydratase n=1 Tax=Aspergillus homomorphus (strain CBS 101889) TaxID=1450537 RepID=A0A395HTL6_ASPHC|nr:PTPLA-domain-containing protein [Aspergillus homomorphus CBS 101889]RAL10896.1 PTPLA-domain-containing protein [Aspergillus homomorphus CBS 101889]
MSPKSTYLTIYNTINALLWARILLTLLTTLLSPHPSTTTRVYTALEPTTKWTQTLANLELLHSALGITNSPLFTTFTQNFARTVQVWAINHAFPDVTASSAAYAAMVGAWSLADATRYTYFAVLSSSTTSTGRKVPGWLKWLRYSLFLGLYPVGIAGEWWLMFRALRVTGSWWVVALFGFFLGLYLPGSVMMYKYMVRQRRKVLAATAAAADSS